MAPPLEQVVGIVEGTALVVTVTTPAVREVVLGAVRGSGKAVPGSVRSGAMR